MDIPGSILVKWHRLKQNVVGICARSDFIDQIDNFVNVRTNLKRVWVHLFANFALESFPVERSDILVCGTRRLFLLLCQDPRFQTLEVDKSNTTFAFTGSD
jgi:hypothetical protein